MQLETPEKFAFLHIAHDFANTDGTIGNREKLKIEDYCIEMGIDNIIFDKDNYDLDECLDKFKSQKSQRILLLELMILAHVDDEFKDCEEDLMQKISEKFNVGETQVKYASTWGKAVSALREQALLMIDDS
jgi:hypothetical protein